MANEIIIQATLTLQRYSPVLQGIGEIAITQTGTKCVSNVVSAPTSGQATIQIEGTTTIAYLFVKNLSSLAWDDTKYVIIALDTSFTKTVVKLRAGEVCLVPPAADTTTLPALLYARAFGGAAIDICYVAACG